MRALVFGLILCNLTYTLCRKLPNKYIDTQKIYNLQNFTFNCKKYFLLVDEGLIKQNPTYKLLIKNKSYKKSRKSLNILINSKYR